MFFNLTRLFLIASTTLSVFLAEYGHFISMIPDSPTSPSKINK